MRKILYIQIDNNSLPKGYDENVEMLDCRCINDFCSLVGDALVGDLKDENGKPFYRLINPVGKLLMNFKAVDEKIFNEVVSKWYDYLGELLHKGTLESDLTIIFPQNYIDWILQNDQPYYESIGKELLKKNGVIVISSNDIIDDIMASFIYKTSHFLQEKKDDISFVVFSDYQIAGESYIIKELAKYIEDLPSLYIKRIEWENQLKDASKANNFISGNDNDSKDLHRQEEHDIIFKVKDVSFKMIFVKGGTFTMGATYEQGSSAESRERPNHIVKLSSYYIGETVVTQELWQILMGDNPSEYKGLQYPIQNITWYRCQDFIEKLNDLTEKQFRLPTEAEWEFAARGGNLSHNYKYAGSNDMNKVGWSNSRGGKGPHPVAQKWPNELGIFDMSGNVSEWCSDWYGKYNSESQNDPIGPAWGTQKVARSGNWMTSDSVSRVTCRRRWDPSSYGFSFRLALSCNSDKSNNSDNIFIDSTVNGIDSNDEMDYLDNGWPIDGDWPWYNP